MRRQRFALIGAAGFVAPRHLRAIHETGQELWGAHDPSDSVGVLDKYFPEAQFFTDAAVFQERLKAQRQTAQGIDYVSIASPSHWHREHCALALEAGSDAICEKPLVLVLADLDRIEALEKQSGRRVHSILQLRLHPAIAELRLRLRASDHKTKHNVDLTYVVSRGHWYQQSWKGDELKSGGITTNIGVHFFDLLPFLFGELQDSVLHVQTERRAAGYLEYERARVRWFLSIDPKDVPAAQAAAGQRTHRSLTVDGNSVDFTGGFEDLHTRSYEEILAGRGFAVAENRAALETLSEIRWQDPIGAVGDFHPLLKGQ